MYELQINSFDVNELVISDKSAYKDGFLSVNVLELRELLLQDENIGDVIISVVRPGDSARIVSVWDVIEPRTKVSGPGTIFPGWLGPPVGYGEGVINRLSGMALVTCSRFNPEGDEYTVQGEGIIDMSGPIAELTQFSKTNNLVMQVNPKQKMTIAKQSKTVIRAGLKAAKYVADATIGKTSLKSEVRSNEGLNPALPNVVLIMIIAGSTPMLDNYVYGFSCIGMVPTLIHMNELAEGALVSSSALVASTKNVTYDYQNNPLIEYLYKYHGIRHNFVGVIIQRGYTWEYSDKERLSSYSANLARFLRADGAIITSDTGGHILTDTMLTCRECEKRGIKTGIIMAERCGQNGIGSGFVDFVQEANLIISVGNAEEMVHLPSVDVAYGGTKYVRTEISSKAQADRVIFDIVSANSTLGSTRVRARDY